MIKLTKYITIAILNMGLFTFSYAQPSLRGRIVEQNTYESVLGATISYIDRKIVSGDSGMFLIPSIDSEGPIRLVIDAVGYEKKDTTIRLPISQQIDIPLIPITTVLEEVVVSTGYQRLPRERATGSFDYIDTSVLNEQVGTGILDRLEAVANSLQVDRTSLFNTERIVVRGLSTIQGPTEPLIVLDNFPYEGDINNINPNDVESITILKDAAAASIWGARAGNGVIVITTKKRRNEPFNIEFNSNVKLGGRPDLFRLSKISADDFIDVEMMLYDAGYYDYLSIAAHKPALSPVIELLLQREDALPGETAYIENEITRLRGIDVRDDFRNYVYQRAVNQQYYLGIRGGTKAVGWNMSVGHDRNTDNLASRYDRFNLRVQNTMKLSKNLVVNTTAYYTKSNSKSGRPGYGQITSMNNGLFPYAEFADENGNAVPLIKQISRRYLEVEADPRLLDWRYYPLDDYKHVLGVSSLHNLLLSTDVHYTLPIGLSMSLYYQHERQQRNGRNLQGAESFAARHMVNSYSQINTDDELVRIVPQGGILDLSNNRLQSHNVRGQLNFKRSWSSHDINMVAGGEVRAINNDGEGNRVYGYDDDILTYANVDYTRQYPNHISGQSSFIQDGTFLSSSSKRYVSVYSNAAYTYKNRYILSLSGRRDASNLFGLNTNDKWNLLWSSGLSWDVSKEGFYEITFIPYLKLRVTYGHSGNINPEMVALTTIQYANNPSSTTQLRYSSFNNFANPELTWETVTTTNAAIDFATRNRRISGSIEFYGKRGKNLYGPAPVDYTAGIGYRVTKNVASIKGRGFDIEINSRNLDGKIKWQSHLNLSINKETVTDYYLPDLRANRFVGLVNSISGLAGKPVRSVFSYKWAGLDPETGEARGYLGDEISKNYRELTGNDVQLDALVYHGSTLPLVFGSLGNTFSWRNLHLTARVTYKFDYYFRRETIQYSSLFGNWNGHGDFNNRWKKPGDERFTNVPALVYPVPFRSESFYPFAEPFVERGDHIRLQYISISYDLTKSAFPFLPLKKVGLYVNFSNLGLIWKSSNASVDPDFATASSTSLPTPFSVALGLRCDL